MPIVKFQTNLPADKLPEDLLDGLCSTVAGLFGIDTKAVMLLIYPGLYLRHQDDTKDPRVLLEVDSIQVEHSKIAEYGPVVTSYIVKGLDIPKENIMVQFNWVDSGTVTLGGLTISDLLKAQTGTK